MINDVTMQERQPVNGKAAVNNFPFQYVVERTWSEFKAGKLSQTPVANYASLPAERQAHDGRQYWAPDAILNQNAAGTLRLGGAMTAVQVEATTAGKSRAQRQLNLAAYVVTALSDCNGNGVFDVGTDLESAVSNMATATAQ